MSRWEQALDEQTALLNFWRSPRGTEYAFGFAKDVEGKGRDSRLLAATAQIEGSKLERGDPVFVDAEVLDLVEHAAAGFRPEEFLASDLFCEEGFALFERAVYLQDAQAKKASFRAMSWGPVVIATAGPDGKEDPDRPPKPFMHFCLYAHIDDPDDYNPGLLEDGAMLGLTETETHAHWRRTFGSDLSMFHALHIPFGGRFEDIDIDNTNGLVTDEEAMLGIESLWKFIQSFYRLAQQRIAHPTEHRAPRGARRRAARIGKEAENVLVITLRREKRSRDFGEGEEEVQWTRRWMVAGHWRSQWYPAAGIHRQIWIAPYVKGPEDKPLVLHASRVFEFTR